MTLPALKIDAKRRAVLPAEVLADAGITGETELIPHAEGPGRIVFETRAAMQARLRARYRTTTGAGLSPQQAWAEYHAEELAAENGTE